MTATLDTLTIRFGGMNTHLSGAAVADLVEELRPDSDLRARLIRRVEDTPHMFHQWQREAILRAAEIPS